MRRVDVDMRPITRGVGYIFLAFCLSAFARIIVDLILNLGNDFFGTGTFDTLFVLIYQMLFIVLTFGLYLMVNRRLVVDLEHDIIERKQADTALRLSEEKFFKAFHSSPDAILISRLEDGRLIEVNEGFSRLTGYSREEALSDSAINLGLWLDLQDRERLIAALQERQRIRDQVYEFHIKSGGTIVGLYSGEIIYLDDKAHILSIVRDISEQKQKEELTRLRLELWEYAAAHSLEELMQKALDEIGALTGSPIGFYHFVEEDQRTLSLQTWSTRTLAEFCQAEGKGLHYSIDKAGVWADAFHQRKPVIHNDYAALSHRKGLPEGHAEVVRQLVVPVLRDGQVVSILGVGNKSFEYDENDVELVSYIADTVWTIVERKRAEEQIRQLNSELERLAMTDELTGILNRRSFFRRGAEEINRFLRYRAPLTLLILDIDGFKKINDTYGHMAGDQVLKDFVSTLQCNIRRTDILARLGGEEFGIILQNTGQENASITAEKLRMAVEKQACVVSEGQIVNVTVSIGLATANGEVQSFGTLLKNADAALYRAKDQGRNKVFLHCG
jgi:diguanylate cyclase (GGDEF)-like protein/PAS domain S-box-containing protein